jgi:translation initiation factor IF-1
VKEKVQVVVAQHTRVPANEETLRISRLIGRVLTRVEIREGGVVMLEFDPHGSITIRPEFRQEVVTSLNPFGG